jgi:hypothetical protein
MRRKYPWDDENPTCAKCGVSLTLLDGCEWGDDTSLVMCTDCFATELGKARKTIKRLRFRGSVK